MKKMKRTKIVPVRWIDEQHDSDWDKVPNYRDCQPFNPHRQDNEKEKITVNELKRNPVPGYQYAQPAPVPEYQYAQQFQTPSRMYDTDINLPAVKFKFIRYVL